MAIGAPTVVTGMRSRNDLTANREEVDFETGIALLEPNANPKTLAVMEMEKKTTGSIEHHWFEDELFPETDTVNGASFDASSTWITMDNYTRFALGDLVMHNRTREVALVVGTDTNKIQLTRDYGQAAEGWTALVGAITDGDTFTVVGNAFEQGHPLPTIRSTKEVDYKNYHQDMRTPLGISEISEASDHRGEQDWPFQQRKAGISHMRKLEYNGWWGRPVAGDKAYYDSSVGNTNPSAAGGINHYLAEYAPANQKQDHTDITQDEFQNLMEYVFEYGDADVRYCYCPPRLRTALDRWGISSLNTFTKDTMFGMAVGRWLSSHGEVVFVTHKMLKNPQADDWLYCFFLDFDEMSWRVMQKVGSTRLRGLRPYEATGETGKKQEFQSVGSIKYGAMANHTRLRFKTWSM